jgi:hypothetical protein
MRNGVQILFSVLIAASAQANIYTVTDTTASSTSSLAYSIAQANAHLGADTIEFNIPGLQDHRIISDSLNDITDTLFINGFSQPASTITLIGINGLVIRSAGCKVAGLRIGDNTTLTALTILADSGKSCSHTYIQSVFIVGIYGIKIYTDTTYGLSSNDIKIDSSTINTEQAGIEITSGTFTDLKDILITNNEISSGYWDVAFYETPAIKIFRKGSTPANPEIKIMHNLISGHVDLQGYLDSIYIAHNSIHSGEFSITNCSMNNATIELNDFISGPGTTFGEEFRNFLNDTIRNIRIQNNTFDAVKVQFSFNGNNQYFDSIIFSGNVLSAVTVKFYKGNTNNPDSQVVKNLIVKNNSSTNATIAWPFNMEFEFSGKSVLSDVHIENNTLETYFSYISFETNPGNRIKSISFSDNYIACDDAYVLLYIANNGITDTMSITNNSFLAVDAVPSRGISLICNGAISNLRINGNNFSLDAINHDMWISTCGIGLAGRGIKGEIVGNIFTNCTDAGIYISNYPSDSATALTINYNNIFGSYYYGIAINSVPYNPPTQEIGRYTIQENSIYNIGQEGIYRKSQHDTASCMNCIPAPQLLYADYFGGYTYVHGMISGDTLTDYIIEIFINVFPDPGGYSEGQTFIFRDTITTDSTGIALFTVSAQTNLLPYILTSTATSIATWQTSEFSNEISVTVGQNELNPESEIMVFPNPVSKELFIYPAGENIYRINLIDIVGKSTPLEISNLHSNKISLENLSSGIYFLEIFYSDKTFIKKILKN